MDLPLMRMLVAVHDEGSLSRAGERLGLTQQAVNAQLQKLERQVGRVLVQRRSSPTRLTRDGEAMLVYAQRGLKLADDVRRHFAAAPLVGTLRIGIVEAFTLRAFAMVLGTLRETMPDLEISAMIAQTSRLETAFENGALDLILGLQRVGEGRGEVVLRDRLRWLGDLAPYERVDRVVRIATFPEPSVARTLIVDALTAAGRPYVVSFESESRASLRSAIMAGIAVSAFCLEMDDELKSKATTEHAMPPIGEVELYQRRRTDIGEIGDLVSRYVIALGARIGRDL